MSATLTCDAGHKLAGDNLALHLDGRGYLFARCRECNRQRARAWRIANAEQLTYRKNPETGVWSQVLGTGMRHIVNRAP